MKTRSLLPLLLLAAFPAGDAVAGVIRGQVEMPAVTASPSRVRDPYAGRAGSLSTARVPVPGLPQDAVVYVETLPAETNAKIPASDDRPKLAQQEQSFAPRVIAVPVGAVVDFPNRDPIYHSVFSVSPTKRFDLGRFGRGKSKSVTFTKTGLVNVYCDIHSNMEAFVLVVPNRAIARPDAEGRFALPVLPPGRYTVVVWHPDAGTTRREVTVPESGDVDVTLRPGS